MLPPVTMSQPGLKAAALPDAASRGADMRSDAAAQARIVRPEMPTAVEAARRAAGLERLREDQGQRGVSGRDMPPSDDAPTGPPPTFDETPLQRQARIALEPPKFDGPAKPRDVDGETSDARASSDAEASASAPRPDAAPTLAARGFADARADFAPVTAPAIDKTA